jgi:hypothetical protein
VAQCRRFRQNLPARRARPKRRFHNQTVSKAGISSLRKKTDSAESVFFFRKPSDFIHTLFKKLSPKLHRKLKIYALQKVFNRAAPRRASAKTEEK